MQVSRTVNEWKAKGFVAVDITSWDDLSEIATKPGINWSCGIYEDDYRNINNFLCAYLIGLDFDNVGDQNEMMTLDEAKEIFSEYDSLILTSRSHQREKNGRIVDRFRVVLKLESPIESASDFYATWESLKEMFPAIDKQCKDPARMWFSGGAFVQKTNGKVVKIVKDFKPKHEVKVNTDIAIKGRLSALTMDLLINQVPEGKRHERLYKAARDMNEQGYTEEKALETLRLVSIRLYGDEHEIDRLIESAFKKESKYQPRLGAYTFRKLNEMQSSGTTDWLVDNILVQGGVSILAGRPKMGKSTLMRQLLSCITNGKDFLGRKVKHGPALLVALDEEEQILAKEAKIQMLENDNFFIHTDPIDIIESIKDLTHIVISTGARIVVLDSLIQVLGERDVNNYNETYRIISEIRRFSKETNCSVMFIHHMGKGGRGGADSVMGSTGIVGAVDCVITLEGEGKMRWLNSKMRGGKNFQNERIHYNPEKLWYSVNE